jgi:hypothetical protein
VERPVFIYSFIIAAAETRPRSQPVSTHIEDENQAALVGCVVNLPADAELALRVAFYQVRSALALNGTQ